ncbi:Peptidylprolyl isomerase [Paramicrosporidium saccamoebae]|uniref:Peptidyl-prolyl cis-trans isomerase n=1 Tax=Paramicrosporidium saccamoebae TaxID=1246581 RepID=A0A2H9TN45_9FUNG|nr:Peptidylprolyl isomerase [Paramicrosporidium saccamoebae]
MSGPWEQRMSASRGVPYYFNRETGESRWEKPTTEMVRAFHLLVKHCGSRKPSSWRQDKITRTLEEALSILQGIITTRPLILGYEQDIKSSADPFARFKELASEYSDCSSAKQGGDLGEFGRGQMQKAFEEAAFALQLGEMSGPVTTDSGVHLIYRPK